MNVNRIQRPVLTPGRALILLTGAALLLAGAAATALAAERPTDPPRVSPSGDVEVPVLNHDDQRLRRTIALDRSRRAYQRAFDAARHLDIAPKRDLAHSRAGTERLDRAAADLRAKVKRVRERRAERRERQTAGGGGTKVGSPASVGVSQGTLEAIAACESGGDPGAISSGGTYRGKYQFDLGTWASVGGSGDPAAAPEAEQDYRAALLMSRSGSSPWPVCG